MARRQPAATASPTSARLPGSGTGVVRRSALPTEQSDDPPQLKALGDAKVKLPKLMASAFELRQGVVPPGKPKFAASALLTKSKNVAITRPPPALTDTPRIWPASKTELGAIPFDFSGQWSVTGSVENNGASAKCSGALTAGAVQGQCGDVLRLLMEKGLVRIAGRDHSLGRPHLYGTTRTFLQVFGLKSLRDLPAAPDLAAKKEAPPARGLFGFWWRERDSNPRPSGYEPDELPLLHPATHF